MQLPSRLLEPVQRGLRALDAGLRTRLQAVAERWPDVYLGLALVTGALGLAYLLLFPLGSLALLVDVLRGLPDTQGLRGWSLAALKFLVAAGGLWLTYALIRTRPTPPSGNVLGAEEAPELFRVIEELRAHWGAAPLHQVLLTADCELELERTPRHGFPFLFDNTLRVGLPLLLTSAPAHARTLLARRVGQLGGLWRRPTGWVAVWSGAFSSYARHGEGRWQPEAVALRIFFSWFAPLYARIALPVLRREELAGDGFAMETVNDIDVRDALVHTAILQRYLDDAFWPRYFALAAREPTPPFLPFAGLHQRWDRGIDRASAQRWLEEALEAVPEAGSALPALRQRLEQIGHDRADLPQRSPASAGDHFLGGSLGALIDLLDRQWLREHLPAWRQRHRKTLAERQRLQELSARAEVGRLADDEAWEYTLLVQRHMSREAIVARYKQLLAADPRDARVQFYIGRYLLGLKDPVGVQALETAMQLDPSHTVQACRLITRYMVDTGAKKHAQHYRRLALSYEAGAA